MTVSGFRFLPKHHLRRPAEFQRVYKRRQIASDERVIVYCCQNELGHPRIGLSVSRKVGGAVERNRWKRLLREAFRLSVAKLPQDVDLVIVPRPDYRPELESLKESLEWLARKAAAKRKGK